MTASLTLTAPPVPVLENYMCFFFCFVLFFGSVARVVPGTAKLSCSLTEGILLNKTPVKSASFVRPFSKRWLPPSAS